MNVKRTGLSLMFCCFSLGCVCVLVGCSESNSGEFKPFASIQSGHVENLSEQNEPDSQNAKPAESQPAELEPVLAIKPPRSEQREIKILIPEKKFRIEGPQKAIRVTYDDINLLKVINMEPVTLDAPEHMPDWLKGLNEKRIRIRGFMSPTFEQTGLKGFLMGRDNQACCFPGRAKIYDLFLVRMREGVTTDFIDNRPFDIVGIFSINALVEDGTLYQLYQIDDAVVIEK